ncbi:MAG: dTMP kinase [Actinomycetota bacterium]
MSRGRLIAFEGGEGIGKSTQAERLARHLEALLTREPGGTDVGERVRALLLDRDVRDLDARAEALLMAAARAHHVATMIRPALDSGRDVVTDRYSHSSLAYQGYGRGLDVGQLHDLSSWATDELWPDLVVLLDVPADEAAARRRRIGHLPDRLEAEADDFHHRVVEGFRTMAAAEPDRWLVVDGTGDADEVTERVLKGVDARLAS